MNRKPFSVLLMLILIVTMASVLPVEASVIWSDGYKLTVNVRWMDILSDITQTSDDRIWIIWQSDKRGRDNFTIYYKIYNVHTGTWGNEALFTNDPYLNLAPSITQTADGTIWVTWSSNRMGNYDLFYKTSIDNGLSWSNETRLTTDPANDYVPCVMKAKDGKLWVVWQRDIGGTNKEIFYKTFNGSWSNDTQLVTNPNIDRQPSVMQASDGKIWVFWCSNRTGGNFEIFCKIFNGSWSNDTQLTFSSKDDEEPTAFLALDGTLWLIWTASDPQKISSDLYYMVSSDNGATWSLIVQLTTTGADRWPSAVQARDKRIWITWTSITWISSENGNYDIYYKFTLRGDVNNDGSIDISDLELIARALWTTPASNGTPGNWGAWNPSCELNNDGIIDVVDLAIASVSYGRTA